MTGERTSANGNRYFSGFLGHSQLLMFRGEEITRDNGEIVQTWNLLLQERDQAPRQRLPERGQRTWDRSRDVERHAARSRAQAAGEAILQHAPRERDFHDDADLPVADLEGRGR